MTFTAEMSTPAWTAPVSTASSSAGRPDGSAGSVNDTCRPGFRACRAASAWSRSALAAVSSTAAPSISKSILLTS
jgi:hypothetical protein